MSWKKMLSNSEPVDYELTLFSTHACHIAILAQCMIFVKSLDRFNALL